MPGSAGGGLATVRCGLITNTANLFRVRGLRCVDFTVLPGQRGLNAKSRKKLRLHDRGSCTCPLLETGQIKTSTRR